MHYFQVRYAEPLFPRHPPTSLKHIPPTSGGTQRFEVSFVVMFASYKLRDGEWDQLFNGYGQDSFRELIKRHPSPVLLSAWTTADVRPDRKDDKWLNGLIGRVGD